MNNEVFDGFPFADEMTAEELAVGQKIVDDFFHNNLPKGTTPKINAEKIAGVVEVFEIALIDENGYPQSAFLFTPQGELLEFSTIDGELYEQKMEEVAVLNSASEDSAI